MFLDSSFLSNSLSQSSSSLFSATLFTIVVCFRELAHCEQNGPRLLSRMGVLQPIGLKMASFPIRPSPPEGAFSGAKGQSGESRRSVKPPSKINPQSSRAHDCWARGNQLPINKSIWTRESLLHKVQMPVNINYLKKDTWLIILHVQKYWEHVVKCHNPELICRIKCANLKRIRWIKRIFN